MSVNCRPGSASSEPRPRRRYVDVDSQTSSPPALASVTKSTTLPLAWSRGDVARLVTDTVSPTRTGRWPVMEFSTCTDPIAG